MHLYRRDTPRSLILSTTSDEESQGLPSRCLIIRIPEANTVQAVVEFLPKDLVDFANTVRLNSRNVLGCLGLINIANGAHAIMRSPQLS